MIRDIIVGDPPFDREPRHTGLFGQHISLHTINLQVGGGLSVHLFRIISIVDVVSNAHEFSVMVAACKKDDCDAEDLSCRDASEVWRIGFEDEFVDTDRDWADEEGVELLVVL